jgi:hypothetical protein
MSAGNPKYTELFKMGKLPKDQRGKVLGLGQVDKLEKQLNEIKEGMCKECRDKFFPETKKAKPNV